MTIQPVNISIRKLWYLLDSEKSTLPAGIAKIWYRIDDSTAPTVAIQLGKDGNKLQPEIMEDFICKHGLRKQAAKKATKDEPAVAAKSVAEVRDEFLCNTNTRSKKRCGHNLQRL